MRFIHALDVVPYLPGLDTYAHVPFGTWIPSNFTVVLEDRPPQNIDNLNWCAVSWTDAVSADCGVPVMTLQRSVLAAVGVVSRVGRQPHPADPDPDPDTDPDPDPVPDNGCDPKHPSDPPKSSLLMKYTLMLTFTRHNLNLPC